MLKQITIAVLGAVALATPSALAQELPEGVAEIIAALPPATAMNPVWGGVYTAEQQMRGAALYGGNCAKCHGRAGNGANEPDQPESPAIAKAPFLNKWNGQTLATLYEYARTMMPIDNPMNLTDQEYADVIAHVLSLSEIPPGTTELPPDPAVLVNNVITPMP
jgi:hypothetical protein